MQVRRRLAIRDVVVVLLLAGRVRAEASPLLAVDVILFATNDPGLRSRSAPTITRVRIGRSRDGTCASMPTELLRVSQIC